MLHESRIIHSDLKPANFLVVKGCLKLIDFGIAKPMTNDSTAIIRETQVSLIVTQHSCRNCFSNFGGLLGRLSYSTFRCIYLSILMHQ